jgi:protein-tyrosine-phosphatase
MKTVIFLCTENSNRSQMAEAFARMHGKGILEPYSAGSRATGIVNPKAITSMAEKGYDLGRHGSKSTTEVPSGPYDYVITMGCGDQCPWIEGKQRDDWGLDDPKNMPPELYAEVRDEIERRVQRLVRHASTP